MKRLFKLGIITDEVTQDIFEASAFASRHELDCIEVRSVNDRLPFDFLDRDIDEINRAKKRYNLDVCAVSTPLFKCDFKDKSTICANIEEFERCAVKANQIGAKYIRGFDFLGSGVPVLDRAAKFEKIIEICNKYDIICVLEFEPSVHSNTPHKLAELLRTINNPRIRALFDTGNEILANGKASEDAYEVLKPYIEHIHIKDVGIINKKPSAVKVGTGLVDYKKLFSNLISDGFRGSVVLETYYRKNTNLTQEQQRYPGGNGFSFGAYDASKESIIALKKIIATAEKQNKQ